jgi:HSP20 family protein
MAELKEAERRETETPARKRTDPFELAARGFLPTFGLHRVPFSPWRSVLDEMDRMLENFGMTPAGAIARPSGATDVKPFPWAPRIRVTHDRGQFVVRADLPGLAKDDIKVEVHGETLVIHGERKEEKHETKDGYVYNETHVGEFRRVIPLPEGVDATKANVQFRDGVLEIAMFSPPLKPRDKVHTLEIKS